jgi:hypothetical protein
MCGAPSIVPSGGPGNCFGYPGSILVPPTGNFPVPLSVVHPRNNTKGRGGYLPTKQTRLMSTKNAT